MQINKNEIIAGVTAAVLRTFLKKAPPSFDAKGVLRILWKDEVRTEEFLRELVILGYLRADEHGYHVTDQALRFAKAKFLNQLTREQAEMLLKKVIVRAEAINIMPELTHYVEELHVFGSYLTDKANLSDLDMIVCLAPKSDDPKIQLESSLLRAEASGRQLSFLDQAAFGENEVLRILRDGNPRLDLCDSDHLDLPGLVSRKVFPASA
ncbi:hypothetical protein IHQ71_07885 [Rhizobium sp. TH2]|uniref:hypothetical protein n=1 Tax=Rhizobium sp. TH2 TaxID=2775403 RepID=UPI0021574599|nr:hypothetical protein [Rhizobium sp. TH2]UVC10504.1 hypothetical protein IHQ71_07885 [Rhizobium sp. TH2]